MGGHDRNAFGDWTSKLNLARVESYDFVTDENTGELQLDGFGNPIPSGLLNIILLESVASRDKIPYVMPVTGNSMYMGGLPEIGSLCVVGFRQQDQPIIIGFLPFGIDHMVRQRQTIPNLEEGELLLQSSKHEVDDAQDPNFFTGARVWLDRYGRIRIELQDYELITGYLLSNEFTPEVTFVDDPVTGESVFLREKIVGGVERRVDDSGNEVRTYGGTTHVFAGGDIRQTAENKVDIKALKGTLIRDDRGNKFEITEDGTIKIETPSGALEQFTQGTHKTTVGGQQTMTVMESIFRTIGGGVTDIIQEDLLTEVGGDKTDTIGGDVTEKLTDGKKTIIAKQAITLETTDQFGPLKLGSVDSNQPVVLGNILSAALSQLVSILQTPPGIGFGNLGGPVPLNPDIVTLLKAWERQFLNIVETSILSRKVFSEKQ